MSAKCFKRCRVRWLHATHFINTYQFVLTICIFCPAVLLSVDQRNTASRKEAWCTMSTTLSKFRAPLLAFAPACNSNPLFLLNPVMDGGNSDWTDRR